MSSKLNLLDSYNKAAPTDQAILDLFEGEWSSAMPPGSGLVTQPGSAGLFADSRIAWSQTLLGGFKDRTILELGPLEGGHSYMAQQGGASHVLAIEANRRAFLKCLCIKEVFHLDRVTFRLGDFVEYLRGDPGRFDIVFANGVLYHLKDPIEWFSLISGVSDRLCSWTQYYDQRIIESTPHLARFFSAPETVERDGMTFTVARKNYLEAVEWSGYCGGSAEYAYWMSRDTIVTLLERHGYRNVEIGFDDPHHPNGPAFAFVATR